jgi:hypothetical protein
MKILFVGDPASGKTSAVQLLKGNPISKFYVATKGCEVHPFRRCSYIWDVGTPDRKYYENTNICVLFGKNWQKWQKEVQEVSPDTVFVRYESPEQLNAII